MRSEAVVWVLASLTLSACGGSVSPRAARDVSSWAVAAGLDG
jgi:hypothetical protein